MSALEALQRWLKTNQIQVWIQNRSDPHLNEFVPDAFEYIHYLTGFSGSSGFLFVGQNQAALFVDGRYTLQAQQEARSDIVVLDWTYPNIKDCVHELGFSCVAYDPRTFAHQSIEQLESYLGLEFMPLSTNPIDALWKDRPPLPQTEAWILDERYTGRSWGEKIAYLQQQLKNRDCDGTVLSDLNIIAWLTNLRGGDLEWTPVNYAWMYVPAEGRAALFLKAFSPKILEYLSPQVVCHAYDAWDSFLSALHSQTLWVDPEITPQALYAIIHKKGHALVLDPHPCVAEKAVKNTIEIQGFRKAHLYDAVAFCEVMADFEEAWSKGVGITEYELSERLSDARHKQSNFVSLSFAPIVGFGANGAVVHYRPTQQKSALIQGEGILLIDSGAHYKTGTTDLTRTLTLGSPTAEQKDRFTRVLKGHIAVARSRFPASCSAGVILDSWARKALWDVGLDYAHGTGHGVGHCLNVHEGPYSLSSRAKVQPIPVGAVLSNEPGFYQANAYGIRIESLVVVRPSEKSGFLCFETLSMVPIDTRLVQANLLTPEEKEWLEEYHFRVCQTLKPYLSKKAYAWVKSFS